MAQQNITTEITRISNLSTGTDLFTPLIFTREVLSFTSSTAVNPDGTYTITSLSAFNQSDAVTAQSQTYQLCSNIFGESPSIKKVLIFNVSTGAVATDFDNLNLNNFFFIMIADKTQSVIPISPATTTPYLDDITILSNWAQLNKKIFCTVITLPSNSTTLPNIITEASANNIITNNQTWVLVHDKTRIVKFGTTSVTFSENPIANALSRLLTYEPYDRPFSNNSIVSNFSLISKNSFSTPFVELLQTKNISQYTDAFTNGIVSIQGGSMGGTSFNKQAVEAYFAIISLSMDIVKEIQTYITNFRGVFAYTDENILSLRSIISNRLDFYGGRGLIDTINRNEEEQIAFATSDTYRFKVFSETRAFIEKNRPADIKNETLRNIGFEMYLAGKITYVIVKETIIG